MMDLLDGEDRFMIGFSTAQPFTLHGAIFVLFKLTQRRSVVESNIVEETILLTPPTFVKLLRTLAPPSEWQYCHVSA